MSGTAKRSTVPAAAVGPVCALTPLPGHAAAPVRLIGPPAVDRLDAEAPVRTQAARDANWERWGRTSPSSCLPRPRGRVLKAPSAIAGPDRPLTAPRKNPSTTRYEGPSPAPSAADPIPALIERDFEDTP